MVQFFFVDVKISLKERTRLKLFIQSIFSNEQKVLDSINYIFCSDDYLLNINRQFLNHDYYTDIITFNLSGSSKLIDAEVYISVDRVRDNATLLKQSTLYEFHRVMFHGVLHLCGYKDKSEAEATKMREMEEKYLLDYFS